MKVRSVYIILNPNAAKGKAIRMKEKILQGFNSFGIKVNLVLTKEKEDAIKLSYNAVVNKEEVIVAAGGDGTCNECIHGILQAKKDYSIEEKNMCAFGVLPIGRGNDFSFSAKLLLKIEESIAVIANGFIRTIDSGYLICENLNKKRYFINGCGLGFEPLVNFVASDYKHISGVFSYVCALIKILLNAPKAVKLNLFLDEKLYSINTQQISICNGKRMGGAFYMGPEAEIDDGLFDVVFTKEEIPNKKLLSNAMKFLNGSQLKFPNFCCVRCTHVKIEALNGTLPIHVDGEEISRNVRKAELFLNQGSIKLLSRPEETA